jgi:flagellar L-ring protein precursor FlgH
MKRFIVTIAAACLLFACSTPDKTVTPMPPMTQAPAEPEPAAENPGSLFNTGSSEFLFADNRARRVGDVVLVNIVETSSGRHTAETVTEKESTINFGISNWGNKEDARLTPVGPSFGLKGEIGSTPMFRGSAENEFDGEGETTREANITATIAARVVNVLPNGLMQVEGGREIKVNNETQVLVVRGLVRRRDIRPDNSVLSSYLADAHIEYYGRGVVADKQRPGWLTRILDNIWPF